MDSEVVKRYFDIDVKKIIENYDLLRIRNWKIVKHEFPELIISMIHPQSHNEYYFLLLCDDIPISLQIVDSKNFLPVQISEWPQGDYFLNGHSVTKGSFLCIPGIREYHSHHVEQTHWVMTSPDFRLPVVLDSIYAHFLACRS
ncbi:MAG: hypothetical protein P4L45_13055 [Ignavibacteriaceae bacterium]|nr:hypothetical protein [Ignavibacteriaceae bacterium]